MNINQMPHAIANQINAFVALIALQEVIMQMQEEQGTEAVLAMVGQLVEELPPPHAEILMMLVGAMALEGMTELMQATGATTATPQ